MWYQLIKRIFQLGLFFVWSIAVVNFLFASILTFIVFNICLTIFLFWFILTLIGWSISIIPILKFVFIPWNHRRCRLWTKTDKEKSRSVAFFHPYCNSRGDQERLLWTAIESILQKYENDIQIIIYTGDVDIKAEEIFQSVKRRFNIDMNTYESAITFIYLRSRFLIEAKYFGVLTSLGRTIGSIILGFEALIHFIPDIYVDTSGHIFTYPCMYYLASIPIVSYVHSPAINSTILDEINSEYTKYYDNNQLMTVSTLLRKFKFILYQIYTYMCGWCGRCAKAIYCNSSWTKANIESIWRTSCTHLVYPPCDIKELLEMPLLHDEEQQAVKNIVSIGQFRRELNHELQIRSFHELLQREPDYCQQLKLILIGYVKDAEDQKQLEKLKLLVDDLNITNEVTFKVDINFQQLKTQVNHAIIGLHTMENDNFSTDNVF